MECPAVEDDMIAPLHFQDTVDREADRLEQRE
jgi:hypothetical protein